jgi:hypothetical protein
MTTFASRPIPMELHPLNRQAYIVPTPSIDMLHKQIKICIRQKVPGAIVYAMTRYGKTLAVRYIAAMLKLDFPGVLTMTFGCEFKKVPSESAFFTNLLEAINHENPDTGTAKKKRSRLYNKLMELISESGQNTLIVFADEAQKLQVEEYEWLREIHDKLEMNGCRMITFLIGQPQLKNQKSALKAARQTQIVGRFMIDEIEFHGVLSAADLATCLRGYDTSIYPIDSDWTFTQFFLPQAWYSGLRLSNHAHEIWNEFERIHEEGGYPTALEVPMTYLARTIEIILTDLCVDSLELKITPNLIKEAIKRSRFAASEDELLIKMDALAGSNDYR